MLNCEFCIEENVSADDHKGDAGPGMGPGGRNSVYGRCLHRPPRIRRGGDRPSAGSRRIPGGDRTPAQLARRPARLHETGRSAALFRRDGGSDGLDGQPLHGQPAPAPRRRLHAGRQGGIPAGPCGDGLRTDTQTTISPRTGGGGRHRSLAATADPLRLLERRAETLDSGGVGRRPADLRHGRGGDPAGGQSAAQRLQRQAAAQNPPGSFPFRRKLCCTARPGDDDTPAQL